MTEIMNGCKTESAIEVVRFLKEKGLKAKRFDGNPYVNINGMIFEVFSNYTYCDWKLRKEHVNNCDDFGVYFHTLQKVDFNKYNDEYRVRIEKSLKHIS